MNTKLKARVKAVSRVSPKYEENGAQKKRCEKEVVIQVQ